MDSFPSGIVRGKADYTENRTSQEGRLAPALANSGGKPLFLTSSSLCSGDTFKKKF
jgi:hypothetical protein